MNKVIWIVVLIIVVVGGVALFMSMRSSQQPAVSPQQSTTTTQTTSTSPTQAMAQNAVVIKSFAFSPASLTVKVGDKVTWTNQDTVGHSATADDSSFDTGILATGQSGSATFSKAGTYTYHCSVHPTMKATIVVQ